MNFQVGLDVGSLRTFLVAANEAGYASGDERQWAKEVDGSTTITFANGEWRLHDNFFGGEPYGGRSVVFFGARPVWIMVYYGWVEPGRNAAEAYSFLRKALRAMPAEAPFRGPGHFEADGLIYANSWDGELSRFSGLERITDRGSRIYEASYAGGIVDNRPAT